jgi:hypothetical protein
VRGFALLAVALSLSQGAASLHARLADDLPGAWWIGHFETARLGKPATTFFIAHAPLETPADGGTLRLHASGSWEAFLDGAKVAAGMSAPAALQERRLVGPIAAGEHTLAVVVTHPEGVAALRLALEFGGAKRREVVTGPSWRVDDDVKRMETGFGGARYPATLWARPPLSVFSPSASSSSTSP